jgi:hypothetical protein
MACFNTLQHWGKTKIPVLIAVILSGCEQGSPWMWVSHMCSVNNNFKYRHTSICECNQATVATCCTWCSNSCGDYKTELVIVKRMQAKMDCIHPDPYGNSFGSLYFSLKVLMCKPQWLPNCWWKGSEKHRYIHPKMQIKQNWQSTCCTCCFDTLTAFLNTEPKYFCWTKTTTKSKFLKIIWGKLCDQTS